MDVALWIRLRFLKTDKRQCLKGLKFEARTGMCHCMRVALLNSLTGVFHFLIVFFFNTLSETCQASLPYCLLHNFA